MEFLLRDLLFSEDPMSYVFQQLLKQLLFVSSGDNNLVMFHL